MNNAFNIGMLIGGAIGLFIVFIPSILAVLRGNFNKGQVIKYQLLVVAVNIAVSVAVFIVGRLVPVM